MGQVFIANRPQSYLGTAVLKVPRPLPYLIGLIVLAFALGSLPRSTPGGSLLFRAYWLLYLVFLAPIIVLAAMVAVIVLIGLHYREIGAAIGFKMAHQKKARKPRSRYSIFIQMFFWALAIGVLVETKGSIFNPSHATNSTIIEVIGTNETAPIPTRTGGILLVLSNFVQNSWFSLAFLGLLVVGGVVVVQSIRVALKETSDVRIKEAQGNQEHGLQAIQEAIKLVEDRGSDPRSRIIASYQHLVATVAGLGAPVSANLTARELDEAVRSTFVLKGPETTSLTQLFEEARYSLHEVNNSDADRARKYLESIAEELKIQLTN